jgi:hypothetical protein
MSSVNKQVYDRRNFSFNTFGTGFRALVPTALDRNTYTDVMVHEVAFDADDDVDVYHELWVWGVNQDNADTAINLRWGGVPDDYAADTGGNNVTYGNFTSDTNPGNIWTLTVPRSRVSGMNLMISGLILKTDGVIKPCLSIVTTDTSGKLTMPESDDKQSLILIQGFVNKIANTGTQLPGDNVSG